MARTRMGRSDPGRNGAAAAPAAGGVGAKAPARADARKGGYLFLGMVRSYRSRSTLLRYLFARTVGNRGGLGGRQPHHMRFPASPWGDRYAFYQALRKASPKTAALERVR